MTETSKPRRGYALGVDPGTTTGMAAVGFDLEGGMPRLLWHEQLPWEEAAAAAVAQLRKLRHASERGAYTVVACEKFTLNAQTAQRGQGPAEDAIGMIGWLRGNCVQMGVRMANLEQASAAKTVASDAVLKYLKLHTPGRVHVNDAARQAVLYAIKGGWLEARVLAGALLP